MHYTAILVLLKKPLITITNRHQRAVLDGIALPEGVEVGLVDLPGQGLHLDAVAGHHLPGARVGQLARVPRPDRRRVNLRTRAEGALKVTLKGHYCI